MTVTLNGKSFEVDAPAEGVTISNFVSRLEIGQAPGGSQPWTQKCSAELIGHLTSRVSAL